MEAKLGIANIVRRYNLLPSDKTVEPLQLDPQSGVVAYVKDGLHIKVEKRFWFKIYYISNKCKSYLSFNECEKNQWVDILNTKESTRNMVL